MKTANACTFALCPCHRTERASILGRVIVTMKILAPGEGPGGRITEGETSIWAAYHGSLPAARVAAGRYVSERIAKGYQCSVREEVSAKAPRSAY